MTANRTWWKTGIGLAVTGVMLFPVYWMVNVSFTQSQHMRKTPPDWFPIHGTLDGYRAVLDQQLPYLGTSVVVGLGTVVLTLLLSAPAGYALAKLRPVR
jgi:multiple sugar transport system permease protein